jgi:PAS domain S-box-containing protein
MLAPTEAEPAALKRRLEELERAVAERDRLLAELRAKEERMERLWASAPVGVFQTDLEGRCTFSNPRCQAITGLSAEAVLGYGWLQAVHPEDREEVLTSWRRTAEAGLPWSHEHRLALPPGTGRWVRSLVTPMTAPNGELVGYVGTLEDVTERKRAEAALRQSEELHRLIADLTSDYAYVARFGPDGKPVIDSVTAGFLRVTGYTPEELNGLGGWLSAVHPEDLPTVHERLRRLVEGERGVGELRCLTKGGEVRWIRYSTHPVWDVGQGRVTRFVGAIQDVTERKRDEERLREYAEGLRTLSRRLLQVQEGERRRLARELHDEVGQDLTGLRLSLEMLGRLSPEEASASLSAGRALVDRLIAQVRKLSLDLRPAMLDDLGLVPALVWQLQRYTAQTGVRVDLEHRGLEGRRFPPDVETAAYRIVQEALTNVARYAQVATAAVRLWLDQGALHVQIEDSGAGFDPATTARGATSGLSGMQEWAVLLGGRLRVDSRPGKGTRLTAELPIGGVRG